MIPASIGADSPRVKTGISGFDQITQGGLVQSHLYLVKGSPGSGKTTLGLQFLLEGLREGEVCLYLTLSETTDELLDTIRSHGWSPGSLIIYELFSRVEFPPTSDQYTFFHASEIELTQTMARLEETIEKTRPQRIIIDSLTELRLITRDPLLLRRHLAALKSYCMKNAITVLMLIDLRTSNRQLGLQTLAHGVIHLDQVNNQFGGLRRRFKVIKLRGSDFLGGVHDFIIQKGGIKLFPRSYYMHPQLEFEHENISSGLEDLDHMLGGGVDRGSATLIMGQAGVGKSNIATQFVWQSAHLGKRCSVFIFDEQYRTYLKRASGLGHDLQGFIDQGLITIEKVEPSALSPGEFINLVRTAADAGGAQVIVIDSLDGYMNVIPTEKFLMIQLHELMSYLSNLGITTFLTTAQHGLVVSSVRTGPRLSVSFLADSVILLQYFEAAGRIRKAISIVKKRTGAIDNSIHELAFIDGKGLRIGAALNKFQGVLTGVPTYLGPIHELFEVEGSNDSLTTSSPH
jgi:circadian clock protein KaiC